MSLRHHRRRWAFLMKVKGHCRHPPSPAAAGELVNKSAGAAGLLRTGPLGVLVPGPSGGGREASPGRGPPAQVRVSRALRRRSPQLTHDLRARASSSVPQAGRRGRGEIAGGRRGKRRRGTLRPGPGSGQPPRPSPPAGEACPGPAALPDLPAAARRPPRRALSPAPEGRYLGAGGPQEPPARSQRPSSSRRRRRRQRRARRGGGSRARERPFLRRLRAESQPESPARARRCAAQRRGRRGAPEA